MTIMNRPNPNEAFPNMLISYEYDYTADADIGIDDVAEDAVGDILYYSNSWKCRRRCLQASATS